MFDRYASHPRSQVGKAYTETPDLLSSGIQPLSQPGRITQSGCQDQHHGVATPTDSSGVGRQHPKISLERSASAAESMELFLWAAPALELPEVSNISTLGNK
jgi:hypothetical protein